MRRNMSSAAMLALAVSASGQVEPPGASDRKPEPRRTPTDRGDGIPFPHLMHVSRETLNGQGYERAPAERAQKKARRRARMRLRKRRGWR